MLKNKQRKQTLYLSSDYYSELYVSLSTVLVDINSMFCFFFNIIIKLGHVTENKTQELNHNSYTIIM